MAIVVEFYGVARRRAGIEQAELSTANTLGDAILQLGERYPGFARDCSDGDRLRAGFRANLDGNRFVSDPRTPLSGVGTLLIMTSDAGG